LIKKIVLFAVETTSNSNKEDIVSHVLSMLFSRLPLKEKLELFTKGIPTSELNLVQKAKAFKTFELQKS